MQNIAIFGVPRSGTSWLGQIFNSSPNVAYRYQPIFAYSFPGSLSAKSTTYEINNFHDELLKTDDEFVCQHKNISGNKTPHFNKDEITYLVWKEVRYLNIIENLLQNSSTKVIGIVRHPCGVLKSWMQAPKEFDSEWTIEEEWQYAEKKNDKEHEFYGYEKWIEATEMFIELENKYPKQFTIVRYEGLVNNLTKTINALYSFTGLPIAKQTELFLKASTTRSSDDPYDVYRKNKKTNAWKELLPPRITDSIVNDERYLELRKRL